MSTVTAHATVIVTLEIQADGCWGPDCKLEQIDKQARESVLSMFSNIYGADKLHRLMRSGKLRVVGRPQVTRVLVSGP